jgi:hypothetical protein
MAINPTSFGLLTDALYAPTVYGRGVAPVALLDVDALYAPTITGTRAQIYPVSLGAETDALYAPTIYGRGVAPTTLYDTDTLYPPAALTITGCDGIRDRLQALVDGQQTLAETSGAAVAEEVARLLAIIKPGPCASWVEIGGEWLPALSTLVWRINNIGGGLSRWTYCALGGEEVINLPSTVTPALTRVWVNGAAIGPDDITIEADSVTLDWPLNRGDKLRVRTYG